MYSALAPPSQPIHGFDPNPYLARINFTGPADPNPDTLRRLHLAHLRAVPFENLDISLGRPIVCDEQRFLHKIVTLRRGGFCYELNGAFAALLRTLGYNVTLLSARVSRPDGSASPEFDHLALHVHLDEPWLADVGFGDSFLEPLRLNDGIEQEQHGHRFRIAEVGDVMIVQRQDPAGVWNSQYQFRRVPKNLTDFARRCHFHQTSPESHFTQQRICTLPTLDGRITLADLKFICTRNNLREERLLNNEEEWLTVLKRDFGVKL
jgi:N-hydroxyarylamine O-acetyltransferase